MEPQVAEARDMQGNPAPRDVFDVRLGRFVRRLCLAIRGLPAAARMTQNGCLVVLVDTNLLHARVLLEYFCRSGVSHLGKTVFPCMKRAKIMPQVYPQQLYRFSRVKQSK